jgi:hypothetical protein
VSGDGWVELADAIGLVRQQLVTAQLAGRQVVAGRVLTFAVGKVTPSSPGRSRPPSAGRVG